MNAIRTTLLGTLIVTAAVSTTFGQQFEPMQEKAKRRVIAALKDHLDKIESPQVEIDPDPAAAVGLKLKQNAVLLVPQKDLADASDDEETRQAAQSAAGTALGYLLFSSSLTPVVDGNTPDEKKLRKLQVVDPRGGEQSIRCLILAVRQASEDDWRLLVYGTEKKPLIDVPFADAPAKQKGPVSIRVKDISGRRGRLVINVLEKYEASFQLEYGG